jgi:hypothetical protein
MDATNQEPESNARTCARSKNELEDSGYLTREERVRGCYTLRVLNHALPFPGLADAMPTGNDMLNREFHLTRRPLFSEVVQFQIP